MYSDRNLIINYIPPDMSDVELRNLFGQVGEIRTCRIIRDSETGLSYGFGFCEFHDPGDAHEAIKQYNGYRIMNKRLKVALARMPGEESKNCNLYLQNLPASVDVAEVERTLSQFGNIIRCRILKDNETGNSRRIGFVLFETHSAAKSALDTLNNKAWPNHGCAVEGPLTIRFADDNAKKVRTSQPAPQLGMWPAGGRAGPLRNSPSHYAGNRYNPLMGAGGGGGGGPAAAMPSLLGSGGGGGPASAMPGLLGGGGGGGFLPSPLPSHMNHHHQPMPAAACYPPPPQSMPGKHVVYVYNCGNNMTSDILHRLFAVFGSVVKVDVPRDPNGGSKNFGFVTFSDYYSAMTAITNMNGYDFVGKKLQVSFKMTK